MNWVWPWRWFHQRRAAIGRAETAMRAQLAETKSNNARNREVLQHVREAAALAQGSTQ